MDVFHKGILWKSELQQRGPQRLMGMKNGNLFFFVSEAASSVEQCGVPGSVSLGAPSERVALPGAPGQH